MKTILVIILLIVMLIAGCCPKQDYTYNYKVLVCSSCTWSCDTISFKMNSINGREVKIKLETNYEVFNPVPSKTFLVLNCGFSHQEIIETGVTYYKVLSITKIPIYKK